MHIILIVLLLFSACTTRILPQRNPQSYFNENDGLSDYQANLLSLYSDGAYSYLNYMLRKSLRQWENGKPFEVTGFDPNDPRVLSSMRGEDPLKFHEYYLRYHYQLNALLEQHEEESSYKLYRGIKTHTHLKGLKAGSIFRDSAYISTSTELEIAKKFASHDPKDPDAATGVVWEIEENARAMPISTYSASRHEWEWVIRPASLFEVIDILPPQGSRKYTLLKLRHLRPGTLSETQLNTVRAQDIAFKTAFIKNYSNGNADLFARQRKQALDFFNSPLTVRPDLPEFIFSE